MKINLRNSELQYNQNKKEVQAILTLDNGEMSLDKSQSIKRQTLQEDVAADSARMRGLDILLRHWQTGFVENAFIFI